MDITKTKFVYPPKSLGRAYEKQNLSIGVRFNKRVQHKGGKRERGILIQICNI